MKEASKFAETTQILMNVSEFTDVSQATDTLISAVQAFGYTADTSMEVVDLLNTIGNNYAISTADLAQSLTKSSASLVAAGGDLAEAAALTATANKIVQDADSVGTALKTTSLRLRGTDVSVLEEEGLDSDGAVSSKSKLQSKVKALSGVDILTATGEYKSTYEILSQIADVWEDINDMDQAALLELISGKRNSSVIAAILQNPKELKAAFEDANNASGSALKENEKYLDSIQGKIDQFTNATQTMWSNFLDADVIKFVVELGTNLIKIVDTIGLIPTILASIGTVKGIQFLFKGFSLKQIIQDISGLTMGTKMFSAETMKATMAMAAENTQFHIATSSIVDYAVKMGLATSAEVANMTTTQLLGLSFKALGVAIWSATKAITAFLLTNPVGWAILAVGAIAGGIAIFNSVNKTTEELADSISDLKSDISNTESSIKSLNDKLDTCRERVAELTALPSLSFVEQEELSNLESEIALLERKLQLEEALLERQEAQLVNDTKTYIKKSWSNQGEYNIQGGTGIIRKDKGWSGFWDNSKSTNEILDDSMRIYAERNAAIAAAEDALMNWESYDQYARRSMLTDLNLDYSISNTSKKYGFDRIVQDKDLFEEMIEDARSANYSVAESIDNVFSDSQYAGLTYGMSNEIDDFLDEYYANQYKWQEAQGISSKSSAIAAIFDDTASESIKKLKEDLTSIANDTSIDAAQKQSDALTLVNNAINNAAGDYDRLKTSMDIVGISADEVARYFVQLSEAYDSSTVEGVTAQYQKGIDALNQYKGAASDVIAEFTNLDGTVEQITWGNLFDKNGDAIDTQISKVLQGADKTTRDEFARIVEAVNNGTMSVENALSSFSGSGLVSVSKLIEESFGELNKSVFKGIADEISGFIDTFSEFSAALEDVANSMELLNTAQEQFDNSGQVSVKTALELMESTDRWNEVLTVEEGKIKLTADAQDVLVQSKLDAVRANLAEAKASIQNQLAQLGAAEATLLSAEASDVTSEAYTTYTNAMNSYAATIAGFGAAIDALINKRFGEGGIIDSFKSAYNATIEVKTYENNTNIAALKEKLAEVETMEDFFDGVDTYSEFDNNYDFDKMPGDKSGEKEREDEAFQNEMDYWDNRIEANKAKYQQLQNEIDLMEAKGQKANAEYYQEQIAIENQRLELLNGQKAAAQEYIETLEEGGKEGSEEWWEVANVLNDIESEIDDVTASIVDLQDAIGEIDTYRFDEFNKRLDNLSSKLGTIRDLIAPNGEEDWFDDEGNWTEKGAAVLGTYVQDLQSYRSGYNNATGELDKYQSAYTGNEDYYASLGIHSEQEYYDRVEELTDQQYEYAQLISDTEQDIVDMYESSIDAAEKYIDTLIDGYNDYIDSVKEALDAERNLYDFKKNVQKQAKDISELERRIMSLSSSTNASDIAERRRLEAQLYDARESLNDTYYDHAQESQQNALDAEAEAYEETMKKVVEDLRDGLETATMNMDTFLDNVTTMVALNAGAILEEYRNTGVDLAPELTGPWEAASAAVGDYSDDALGLMNQWTNAGFLTTFPDTLSDSLTSAWNAGITAVGNFNNSVARTMDSVVTKINSNVQTASSALSSLYQQILDTESRATSSNVITGGSGSSGGGGSVSAASTPAPASPTKSMHHVYSTTKDVILGSQSFVDQNTKTIDGVKYYLQSSTGYYYKISDLKKKRYDGGRTTGWAIPAYTAGYSYYAKGVTGTKRNQWAITDEPQFGDELVLVPGKDGNLSFMRKGTGVIPADLTANLMEWGQFTPDSINLGGGTNINMVNNAVNKPEFNFTFDALVKAEHIDENTLPEVKRFVQQEINSLVKQMNYAIKGKGGR